MNDSPRSQKAERKRLRKEALQARNKRNDDGTCLTCSQLDHSPTCEIGKIEAEEVSRLPGLDDEGLRFDRVEALIDSIVAQFDDLNLSVPDAGELFCIYAPKDARDLATRAHALGRIARLAYYVAAAMAALRPPVKTEESSHLEALKACRRALAELHNQGLQEGLPALSMVGFVWDLRDPMTPERARNNRAAQEAIRQSGEHRALQSGIVSKDEMIQLIEPLAYKLENREPSLIISSEQRDPALVQTLRAWTSSSDLPVVIIIDRGVSIASLPVKTVITPA